ncbi:HEAT repeat domain-containing protein [Pedobacter sp. MR22-3]|uniref:HEAT repeat domain-containing protein n=1 Tax=Pedobacter sp. MR22-3 TaxID=2994552 RepID=UPI00224796CF|nr:hypothetical protein [Pedobacter sp. MR22-3]MCX2582775.1 hypothetical protein [Pedobacter sp. MR22-3]
MNDPIKDFVEQHREDFDHLEAPQFNLAGFKASLAQEPMVKKHRTLNIKPASWMAAAAVLLVCTIGLWFFNNTQRAKKTEQHLALNKQNKHPKIAEKPLVKAVTQNAKRSQFAAHETTSHVKKHQSKEEVPFIPSPDQMLYKKLNDSASSSTRLAAVLAIKKSELISYDMLDRLAATIQHDGNSNVRLAALSVLEKYRQDTHVTNLLVNALNHQNDPMLQLSLVNLLGKMQNVKIDERLYALVNDPSTLEAVKDEVYQILLKENKF